MADLSNSNDRPIAWIATDSYGGGSEVWMRRQATSLDDFDVHVTTLHLANNDSDKSAVPIHVVKGNWIVPRTSLLRWGYKGLLGRFNPVVSGAEMSPAETRWWNQTIQQHRPSVCLAQFGPMAIHLLPIMKFNSVPLIAHFHGHDVTACLKQKGYTRRLREMLNQFDALVVVAEYQKETLLELGAKSNQIHVIPCGVPMPPEVDRTGHAIDQCKFLSVGRLVNKKRPDATLEAFAQMPNVHHSTLTMVGDGPMRKVCQNIIDRHGIGDRVRMLGACSSQIVASEMRDADVFVQHSVTGPDGDREGWPVAIAEAASFGLPIVATRHASIPTQVVEQKTGLLVDEHDVAGMSNAMNELAGDGERRQLMGQHGREHIAETSLEIQLSRLQSVMQDCICRSK
ncbi:glycosyltransferase family 4 protein [Rubripirellula obstinata]|nr:glycosyltransferase family 4 protein [Rubripirellula obstinata]